MDGENKRKPIGIDDLGVPLFLETPVFVLHIRFKVGVCVWYGKVFPQILKCFITHNRMGPARPTQPP